MQTTSFIRSTTPTSLVFPSPPLSRRRHVDFRRRSAARCGGASVVQPELRTCRRCKNQFDPSLNHSAACRFHTAHFGGETKRKFESVHTGGTMNTAESGKILHYWHCCGSENPSDPGCTLGPHSSYDDE